MIIFPKTFPKPGYRNVTTDQWVAWQTEVTKLKALTAYGSENWLINYKSFKESIYWAALTPFGEPYPEETLYKQLSAQSQVQADRIDQLEAAIRQHTYNPSYTASEIPIAILIPYVVVPVNYLNLPMRGSNKVDTKNELLSSYTALVIEANTPTPKQPEAIVKKEILQENQTLNKPQGEIEFNGKWIEVVTGGLSGKTLLLVVGLVAVVVYLIFKNKSK